MAVISVKKPDVIAKTSADDLFSVACLISMFYPSLTVDDAMGMSFKRLKNMLKVAERQEAIRYANLVNITAAPHAKKPDQAISKLLKVYKGMGSDGR